MKFLLFVEGQTEKKALPEFLKRWLDKQLGQAVRIKAIRFKGWSEYCESIAAHVSLHMGDKSAADTIAAIGLLDLYGPTNYPAEKKSAVDRYNWFKLHLEKRVNHDRFRQHFAVHELEAWLLGEPKLFDSAVAKAIPGKPPETVNFDKPPKELLRQLHRTKLKQEYREVIDGSALFAKLDVEALYKSKRCPFFNRLLDDMLGLAKTAGL